jgi:hypothetical protein
MSKVQRKLQLELEKNIKFMEEVCSTNILVTSQSRWSKLFHYIGHPEFSVGGTETIGCANSFHERKV